MTSPTIDDVKEFIEYIKQPENLLTGCRRYHEIEPRDIAYVVTSKLVSKTPRDMSYILAGTRIFLQVWNAVYIQHLNREIKQSMEEDIRVAYNYSQNELLSFEGNQLANIELTKEENANKIKKAFAGFAQYKSIGDTGASKILHLLNPSLFMMWDTKIREAYGKLIPEEFSDKLFENLKSNFRNEYKKMPLFVRKQLVQELFIGDLYLQFMINCQSIAQALQSKMSEQQLWSHHISFSKDTNFMSSWDFSETATKMIDECNFMRWKIGERF